MEILVRKASEIFSVHARWKALMGFVTLNKQKSAIKSPDIKPGAQGARRFFVAASLKFGKLGPNFVKTKHAGRTRLQHSSTVFFAK